MIICSSDKINFDDGIYVLLSDLGCEGLSVVGQYHTPEEAILGMDAHWTSLALVQIVEFEVEITPP